MKSRPDGARRDPGRTREAILAAAQDEFARKGLSGGRVDEIARRSHAELISLINNENLHRARYLRQSKKVRELHSPFVQLIGDILKRGVAKGVFRRGLDPVQLYVSIAALSFFYFSNNWTLSEIFGQPLGTDAACRKRKQHNVAIILDAIRA